VIVLCCVVLYQHLLGDKAEKSQYTYNVHGWDLNFQMELLCMPCSAGSRNPLEKTYDIVTVRLKPW
jgi:hypothetical protein